MTGRPQPARAAVAWCALGAVLCGCGSSAPPRPVVTAAHAVTVDQADRLAVSRFLDYQAGGVRFRSRLVTEQTSVLVTGDVDYRHRIGYAQVTGAGAGFTVQWNATELLGWPSAPDAVAHPAALPAGKPSRRRLAPSSSVVDALLAVLLSLGADRPDNAQLIQQDGARWLRVGRVGRVPVDVIAGPRATGSTASTSPLTYWIDRTGRLLRVDARFGGGAPTSISLDQHAFAGFPRSGSFTS